MNTVEQFSIETTRERLSTALEVANVLLANLAKIRNPALMLVEVAEEPSLRVTQEHINEYQPELNAIYYTMRIHGAEEIDFPEKIKEITVDGIFLEVVPVSDTEVSVRTLTPIAELA